MKRHLFHQMDMVGFFSNMLAVILGIVITFSIQAIINRKHEKTTIKSALTLVRDELRGCRADLDSSAALMDAERKAGLYLENNKESLFSCPADSVSKHGIIFISELILTLPSDALELLKTSSLFSSINDNEMSLAIIKAYDQCDALMQIFNRHEARKSELLGKIYAVHGAGCYINKDGNISISQMIHTVEGENLLVQMRNVNGDIIRNGFINIDAAIEAIDKYLENN